MILYRYTRAYTHIDKVALSQRLIECKHPLPKGPCSRVVARKEPCLSFGHKTRPEIIGTLRGVGLSRPYSVLIMLESWGIRITRVI